MQYTTRQQQIINHFQKVYNQFGRNADTYSIVVWTSDETGFIYPQEIEELIAMGCEFFSIVYPAKSNMWTSPNYRINKVIVGFTNNNKAQYEVACWFVRHMHYVHGVVENENVSYYLDYYGGFSRTWNRLHHEQRNPRIANMWDSIPETISEHIFALALDAWQNNPNRS